MIANPRKPVLTFFRITDAHTQWCRIANPTQLIANPTQLNTTENPTQLITLTKISAFSAIWFHRLSSRSAIQTSLIALA